MGTITHRGLLWAGGLAATPLPPSGAFGYPDVSLPWEQQVGDGRLPRRTGADTAGFPDVAPPSGKAPIRHS